MTVHVKLVDPGSWSPSSAGRSYSSGMDYLKRIDKFRVELSRKKCINRHLLYCFHSAGVLWNIFL